MYSVLYPYSYTCTRIRSQDLHRTGYSTRTFDGQTNEEDRILLKRVLLAFARYNKQVGYCQGFNVLAALILDVVQRDEQHALQVMVYLVERVLPETYFSNNLTALAVDLAVLRELMRAYVPGLADHLHQLQQAASVASTLLYFHLLISSLLLFCFTCFRSGPVLSGAQAIRTSRR